MSHALGYYPILALTDEGFAGPVDVGHTYASAPEAWYDVRGLRAGTGLRWAMAAEYDDRVVVTLTDAHPDRARRGTPIDSANDVTISAHKQQKPKTERILREWKENDDGDL